MAENTEHGQTKYGATNHGETLPKDYPSEQLSNPSSNDVSKEKSKSVVTDTPPLSQTSESKSNLSEIPTGSDLEYPENKNENSLKESFFKNLTDDLKKEAELLKKEVEVLKEKSTDKKTNSGGGAAQNSQPNVSNSNKPKKAVREWFKLASLTDTQKAELNALAGRFDNPSAFIESLDKWLVYKESEQVNFTLKKIPPYKDFDTMLSTITTEAKKCQWQSEVFVSAVKDSINKLYFGLFPEKFISQTVKNGNYNNKIDRATANNEYLEALRRGEKLPY
jgi:hypothetical protein